MTGYVLAGFLLLILARLMASSLFTASGPVIARWQNPMKKIDEKRIIRLRRANKSQPAELIIGDNSNDVVIYVLRDSQVNALARDAVEAMKVNGH